MSKKTQTGSGFARFFGASAFTKVSAAVSTEEFNEAEKKLAAELDGKGEVKADASAANAGAAGSGSISPDATEDPLKLVKAATDALGTKGDAGTLVTGITAEAFQAEQKRANDAEAKATKAEESLAVYKAYFDKHNALGKGLPAADATTTDQAQHREAGLSEASAYGLEHFKARNGIK